MGENLRKSITANKGNLHLQTPKGINLFSGGTVGSHLYKVSN